jgi:hypothetical protein
MNGLSKCSGLTLYAKVFLTTFTTYKMPSYLFNKLRMKWYTKMLA